MEEEQEDPAIVESSKEVIEEKPKKEQKAPYKKQDEDYGAWQRGTKIVKSKEGESTQKHNDDDQEEKKSSPNQQTYDEANKRERRPKQIGELKEKPNEYMQKKYADQFDFTKNNLNNEENKDKGADANKDENKIKYDKAVDFFDNITNSTLDEKAPPQRGGRGGYRGNNRGRGGYTQQDRDEVFKDFDRSKRGGRGGRGGWDRDREFE